MVLLCWCKNVLSKQQWGYCVMLISAHSHLWILSFMMDYSFTHNAALSVCTWVCHFPNPTYIKRHNLLSLLSLCSPSQFSFSGAMMRYGETERIRLPGNWKGAGAARDVRLFCFITHRLMGITRVCLTRCVRGSGEQGNVGTNVVIDWVMLEDKLQHRGCCVCVCVVVLTPGMCVYA